MAITLYHFTKPESWPSIEASGALEPGRPEAGPVPQVVHMTASEDPESLPWGHREGRTIRFELAIPEAEAHHWFKWATRDNNVPEDRFESLGVPVSKGCPVTAACHRRWGPLSAGTLSVGEGTLTCMITSSSTADDASGPSLVWVESMGGPLIVVPVSALASWGGCTESGLMAGDATAPDDYDRACEVDDLAGVIPIDENGAQALVLADEPATSCYLPQHRVFLRWRAAETEAGLRAAADTVLVDPATVWEECGTWVSDGPAVLMDSAEAGSDLGLEYPDGGMPAEAPVPLPAGRWRVRAAQTKVDEENWVGLVQILPAES